MFPLEKVLEKNLTLCQLSAMNKLLQFLSSLAYSY